MSESGRVRAGESASESTKHYACHEICTSRFTKRYACHEICTSRFAKRCTCHKMCTSRFTKCCACHEICTSRFTKCCACHEICTSRFTKCCACHEIYTSRFTTCHEMCTSRFTKCCACHEICTNEPQISKSHDSLHLSRNLSSSTITTMSKVLRLPRKLHFKVKQLRSLAPATKSRFWSKARGFPCPCHEKYQNAHGTTTREQSRQAHAPATQILQACAFEVHIDDVERHECTVNSNELAAHARRTAI